MTHGVVNLWEGDEHITTVEMDGAPLPREGELVQAGPEELYRVVEVIHDGWHKDEVSHPEIILKVSSEPE